MDRLELQRQFSQQRQLLYGEGFVNKEFLVLEWLGRDQPYYVETKIRNYIPSSDEYIRRMEAILGAESKTLGGLGQLILILKEASERFGAAKIITDVDGMMATFRSDGTDTDRLAVALGKVRSQHTALKSNLDTYIEIVARMRGDGPPVEGSGSNEDVESVASNNVDV